MKYCVGVSLSILCLGSAGAYADDDKDPPVPVVVPPKRASIHSRYLPRLIELAENNSPSIKKAKNALEIAELEYKNAFYRFFPFIEVESKLGLLANEPYTRTTPWSSETTLRVKSLLFDHDNNVNFNRYGMAREKFERAKLEYEDLRDEQLLNVANAYFDWSQELELREIDENKRDLLRRQYNILEQQYKQGLKTKRDLIRIETEIKRLEITIMKRDNDVAMHFQKVASHAGLDIKTLDDQAIEGEEAKPFAIMRSDTPELKLEDHRRWRIFKLKEKESSYETRLAERNFWPRVSLESEFKYSNSNYVDSGERWEDHDLVDWQTMVVFRYSIWDFGIRHRDWQIARVKERNVYDENQQKLRELATVVRDVYLRLREFRENVKATRELLVLEQQSYSILEAEYRNGRAPYLDLITNLNSLIDARSQFMTSYFGYKRQQMLYSYHKGELYEELRTK